MHSAVYITRTGFIQIGTLYTGSDNLPHPTVRFPVFTPFSIVAEQSKTPPELFHRDAVFQLIGRGRHYAVYEEV